MRTRLFFGFVCVMWIVQLYSFLLPFFHPSIINNAGNPPLLPSPDSSNVPFRSVSYQEKNIIHRFFQLSAKKSKKLFSDEFLSAINDNEEESEEDDKKKEKETVATDKQQSISSQKKKTQSNHVHEVEKEIPALAQQEDNSNKKKGKNKSQKKETITASPSQSSIGTIGDSSSSSSSASFEEEMINEPEAIAQKSNKRSSGRLSSKIRLTERTQPTYVMMGLQNVELYFGDEAIVRNASFSVSSGERVGLVGPNGGGKSTQLRILSGELVPNRGDVLKNPSNIRVAFLRQEFIDELVLTRSLKEELLSACVEEQKVLQDITACEKEIEESVNDPDRMDDAINRLQELQDTATLLGAYSLDAKIQKIMDSMGFSVEEEDHLVGSFSGGWKMRIGLAKILCTDPNILLLDEPTNHMDFESVLWLEDFLKKQTIPMIIVSHDREFLDQVCNKIVDVEDGKTISYQGNYSKFLQQRRERLAVWREKYEKQLRHIQEEEKWIRKAKNDPVLQPQVKQREQQLQRYKESPDFVPPPPKDKKFRFRFPPAPRCGDLIVDAKGLQHGFGTGKYAVLFKDINYEVRKGNRIGFVGPNGSGKSTMLKIIMGIETPQKGYAEICSDSVQVNYYAQNQADSLNLDHTILEAVQEVASPDITMTEIRGLLGQFLFKSEDVYKKIRMLSGGEKARVALCRMMLKPANLLLLDEPTNHLDITSKEVLEDALLNFGGSVLIVSHDRYFMSQVVNTIFEFGNQTVNRYDCDYHDYLEFISNPPSEAEETENLKVALPLIRGNTEDALSAQREYAFVNTNSIASKALRLSAEREGVRFSIPAAAENQTTSIDSMISSRINNDSGESSKNNDSNDSNKQSNSSAAPSLKDRMVARYVEGDKYKITKAKEVVIEEKNERSKNFGGSGVTSGNLHKGIKNAKRYTL